MRFFDLRLTLGGPFLRSLFLHAPVHSCPAEEYSRWCHTHHLLGVPVRLRQQSTPVTTTEYATCIEPGFYILYFELIRTVQIVQASGFEDYVQSWRSRESGFEITNAIRLWENYRDCVTKRILFKDCAAHVCTLFSSTVNLRESYGSQVYQGMQPSREETWAGSSVKAL